MTGCSEVDDVKKLLQIASEDATYDTELADCIYSADSLMDALLEPHGLTVRGSVPQNIKDASVHYAALLFRKRRDTTGAEAFWVEANRFLDAHIQAEREAPFRVA